MRFSPLPFTAASLLLTPCLILADGSTASTIDLTTGSQPLASVSDAVDTVREGTHFVSRTGHIIHVPGSQQLLMAFDNSADSTPAGPMILLPNLNLLSMESVKLSKNSAANFRVSGTVTEYKGKNYILIDDAQTTLAAPTATPPDAPPAAPSRRAAPALQSQTPPTPVARPPQPAVTVAGDSAQRTMDRLLAPPPNSGVELPGVLDTIPASSGAAAPAAVAPYAPPAKIVREGTHLINRIGRLNHTANQTEAVFTFDADGKTMGDPPMTILPNLKLAAMEGAVLGRAGDLHFRISGTVTEYKGKNYILLDKAVAIADVESQF